MKLDIGCGTEPKGDVNCDLFKGITPHLIRNEPIVPKEIPNFIQCDVVHLPFPDHTFDVVNASEVIEHLENPILALREMKRVSKRLVTLDVPNLRRLTPEDNRFHLYSWSDETLHNLLTTLFKETSIAGAEYGSYLPRTLLRRRILGYFLKFIEGFLYRTFGPPYIKAICKV